jgi:hypothetical protein
VSGEDGVRQAVCHGGSHAALERYVMALLGEWDRPSPAHAQAVVWATDHTPTDISRLVRLVVAVPVVAAYQADADITVQSRGVGDATATQVAGALAAQPPDVIVTTTHGFTGPVDAPDRERSAGSWTSTSSPPTVQTARRVAAGRRHLVCHACCGAGSDSPSTFTGLFERDSSLDRMLTEVAGLGRLVAPLPTAPLSAPRPLRAFVGHVEPTYDWTIRDQPSQHASSPRT